VFFDVFMNRIAGKGFIILNAHFTARCTDNTGRIAELSGTLTLVKGRDQFALGEVARAAENDAVKGLYRNCLAGHEPVSLFACVWSPARAYSGYGEKVVGLGRSVVF